MMTDKFAREFHEFWGQTAGRVRAFMFCTCENWTDADDMTQDCFLRALQAWGQFEGKASRQAWLWGIAKRTRVDWFRRKRRETVVSPQRLNELEEIASEESEVNDVEKVWGAIKRLNEEHGEVIHLKFAAGLSYAQIAQALGIPIGTVRSRLHRGLKEIRKQIGEQENET